jgi:hypothetical protein
MFVLIAWFFISTAPDQYQLVPVKVDFVGQYQCEQGAQKALRMNAVAAICTKNKDIAI